MAELGYRFTAYYAKPLSSEERVQHSISYVLYRFTAKIILES